MFEWPNPIEELTDGERQNRKRSSIAGLKGLEKGKNATA